MHPLPVAVPSAARVPRSRARSAAASAARGSRMSTTREVALRAAPRAASSAITRRSASAGSASGSFTTWSRSSTRSQRRSPMRTSPRTRAATGRASASSASASGTCAVGAVAGDQRQVGPAQPAVDLGHPHAVLVEELEPVRPSARPRPAPARRRGSRSTPLGERPHPRPLDRVEASIRSRTAPTSSSRLEAGRRTKAATRICSARSRLTSGTSISVMVNCGRSTIASRDLLDQRGDRARAGRTAPSPSRPRARPRASARRS